MRITVKTLARAGAHARRIREKQIIQQEYYYYTRYIVYKRTIVRARPSACARVAMIVPKVVHNANFLTARGSRSVLHNQRHLTSRTHDRILWGMANPTQLTIGGEIRRLRSELGLSIQDFAARVEIPWQTIQAYETGRVVPPSDRLLTILHATRRASTPFRLARVARAVALAA